MALGRKLGQLLFQHAFDVEQLVRSITLHPLLEYLDVLRLIHVAHRHLMTSPVAFGLLTVDFGRTGPPFGCPHNDHGPGRPSTETIATRFAPDLPDFSNYFVERRRHLSMHIRWFMTLYKIGLVTISLE